MKKILFLAVVAAGAYVVYRQVMASRAEEDLWSEATAAPDLSSSYQRAQETPLSVVEDVVDDASGATEEVADKAKDVAGKAKDKAEDAADTVADAADDAADAAKDKS